MTETTLLENVRLEFYPRFAAGLLGKKTLLQSYRKPNQIVKPQNGQNGRNERI